MSAFRMALENLFSREAELLAEKETLAYSKTDAGSAPALGEWGMALPCTERGRTAGARKALFRVIAPFPLSVSIQPLRRGSRVNLLLLMNLHHPPSLPLFHPSLKYRPSATTSKEFFPPSLEEALLLQRTSSGESDSTNALNQGHLITSHVPNAEWRSQERQGQEQRSRRLGGDTRYDELRSSYREIHLIPCKWMNKLGCLNSKPRLSPRCRKEDKCRHVYGVMALTAFQPPPNSEKFWPVVRVN
ncbi:hypothetical protein CDAR_195621 [Caerostris darwini]|uniref:Uncharacterized protein n=1 Tax=Caerostris darwini TaxID=1538125 RepID=A0AAV4Q6F7_9ARAC|nr:hypothetical protein CDAR_195621 [Caerostris darwini]